MANRIFRITVGDTSPPLRLYATAHADGLTTDAQVKAEAEDQYGEIATAAELVVWKASAPSTVYEYAMELERVEGTSLAGLLEWAGTEALLQDGAEGTWIGQLRLTLSDGSTATFPSGSGGAQIVVSARREA